MYNNNGNNNGNMAMDVKGLAMKGEWKNFDNSLTIYAIEVK